MFSNGIKKVSKIVGKVTTMIDELKEAEAELEAEISKTDEQIVKLEEQRSAKVDSVGQASALRANLEGLLKAD